MRCCTSTVKGAIKYNNRDCMHSNLVILRWRRAPFVGIYYTYIHNERFFVFVVLLRRAPCCRSTPSVPPRLKVDLQITLSGKKQSSPQEKSRDRPWQDLKVWIRLKKKVFSSFLSSSSELQVFFLVKHRPLVCLFISFFKKSYCRTRSLI
jgi:hypothetical protein